MELVVKNARLPESGDAIADIAISSLSRKFVRLSAGGRWIRTVGPSPEGCGLFSPRRRARSIGMVFDKYRPVGGLAVSNSAPSVGESGPRVARPLAWDNGFPRLQRINARESLLSPDQPNLW